MKCRILGSLLLLLSMSAPCGWAGDEKLLVGGSSWDSIAIIDKETGQVEWRYGLPREYGGPECNSVGVTADGDVLLAFKRGARLVRPDYSGGGEDVVLWDYTDLADTAELQTAKVLADGGFLLGICDGPMRLVELNKKGKVRHEIRYDLQVSPPHAQFRRVLKSEALGAGDGYGNYIIPVMGRGVVVEIAGNGELVREFRVPGGPFDAFELTDGNLLVGLGNRHILLEVERQRGEVIDKIGPWVGSDTTGIGCRLHFVAQVSRDAATGNTLIANWQGYLKQELLGIDPQLIEVDRAGNIVWTFDGSPQGIKYISTFYPFQSTKGAKPARTKKQKKN